MPIPRSCVCGVIGWVGRLSDFLFVAARWAAKSDGHTETVWRKP